MSGTHILQNPHKLSGICD